MLFRSKFSSGCLPGKTPQHRRPNSGCFRNLKPKGDRSSNLAVLAGEQLACGVMLRINLNKNILNVRQIDVNYQSSKFQISLCGLLRTGLTGKQKATCSAVLLFEASGFGIVSCRRISSREYSPSMSKDSTLNLRTLTAVNDTA